MTPNPTASTVHLITGEFPPQFGGVSDYSLAVASGLAANGRPVHVWCPPSPEPSAALPAGIEVHRIAGRWHRDDLARLDRAIDAVPGNRRLLVQWVPHAYSPKSLNVAFCAWVRRRARKGDVVDLMVHEAFLAFGEGGVKQDVAAGIHRLMVTLLLSRAHHVWVSIPAWADALRPYCLGRQVPFEWLPVPSNIAVVEDTAGTTALRQRAAPAGALVVGHFGTFETQVRRALSELIPELLEQSPSAHMVLIGRGSDAFGSELKTTHPGIADRIFVAGQVNPREVSLTLQACDLVVQPYPDGASSRRGTLMAALAHGVAAVTTEGHLSERLWRDSKAVALVPAGDAGALLAATLDLCADAAERRRLADAGRALYRRRFDVANTIQALVAERAGPVECLA